MDEAVITAPTMTDKRNVDPYYDSRSKWLVDPQQCTISLLYHWISSKCECIVPYNIGTIRTNTTEKSAIYTLRTQICMSGKPELTLKIQLTATSKSNNDYLVKKMVWTALQLSFHGLQSNRTATVQPRQQRSAFSERKCRRNPVQWKRATTKN